MSEPVELYCTLDQDNPEDEGVWIVWFPHPLGGKYVLESFDNEADARTFWQEQLNTADYDAE